MTKQKTHGIIKSVATSLKKIFTKTKATYTNIYYVMSDMLFVGALVNTFKGRSENAIYLALLALVVANTATIMTLRKKYHVNMIAK